MEKIGVFGVEQTHGWKYTLNRHHNAAWTTQDTEGITYFWTMTNTRWDWHKTNLDSGWFKERFATHRFQNWNTKSTYDLENVYDVLPAPIDPGEQHVRPFEP